MNRIDHHDWHSRDYVSDWVARSQPEDGRRLARFQLMAQLIPHPKDAPVHILDIGAGYGALAKAMLDWFPKARVVAQDYSDEMLGHARALLAPYGDRVTFMQSDLMTTDWARDLQGPFDAAVSSICIHNLQDAPRIRQLYREVRDLLSEGGCFLNVDLVNAPSRELQRTYWEVAAQSRLARPDRRSAYGGDDWPPFQASVDDQLAWLREAGFHRVDCFWKELGQALVGGYRQG